MDSKTLLRAAETFVIAVVVLFGAAITVGGQQLDLSSPTGRTAAAGAIVMAIADAVRRIWATRTAT